MANLCEECFEYYHDQWLEENTTRKMQVTREMAKDAGYPEMEGTWIDW